MIHEAIETLIKYELDNKIITNDDYNYVKNQIYSFLGETPISVKTNTKINYPSEALDIILDYAFNKGVIRNNDIKTRDFYDAKIMNIFCKKPSEIINDFNTLYQKKPSDATSYLYNYLKKVNYIRENRNIKNKSFSYDSKYGKIEITINLAKPEKDPKQIAREKEIKSSNYPLCQLCIENEGFPGDAKKDSRDNHRIIPFNLNNKKYYFQYSPYSYYNEHAIILNKEHIPMVINKDTLNNLLTLTDIFDGYFFGSNSDIPIVGGSILSHDHYQGGSYSFPIENALILNTFNVNNLVVKRLKWPLSAIRITGSNKDDVLNLAMKISDRFLKYNNESLGIISNTNNERHNAITPIARKVNNLYEMDIILRNNRTSKEYPLGIFHPHEEIWHIKKENIGLIEAMGLAILPGRLVEELRVVKEYLLTGNIINDEVINKMARLINHLQNDNLTNDNIDKKINDAVGYFFTLGLEHSGLFKDNDEAFIGFIKEAIND